MPRHISLLAGTALATAALSCMTHAARADTTTVMCGDTPAGATKPVKATLTLDAENSKTTNSFGRKNSTGHLSLIFAASGCALPDSPADPTLRSVALKGQNDIPDNTLKVQDTTVDTDNNRLILRLEAFPKTFSAGTYQSQVFLKAPYLATNATTITLSRSERRYGWIILIGLGAAVAGLAVALLISLASDKLKLKGRRLALVAVLMLGSGLYAALANWWTQDVWTFDSNLKGMLGAAFVAASTGTLAGLIGGGGGDGK